VTGRGVEKDLIEARTLLLKAAERGHGPSMRLLGAIYARGEGGAQSGVEGAKWLRLAVAAGEAEAAKDLEAVDPILLPAEKEEAQKRAEAWLKLPPRERITR